MPESRPVVAFVPIARPTFDIELAQTMTNTVWDKLSSAPLQVIGAKELVMSPTDLDSALKSLSGKSPDLLLTLQSTFADSSMVLRLAEKLELPVLLWALPEDRVGGRLRLNSFCGINLAGHALTRAGYTYDYLYTNPDDISAIEKIRDIATAAMVRRRLQSARIGRIGENPEGFQTCPVNNTGLSDIFGLEIVQLQLNDVFQQVRNAEPDRVAHVATSLQMQLDNLDILDRSATNGTLGTYVTLQDMAREHDLAGLAVRCWPEFFTDLGCSACGAMSMLSDEYTPCSCEADVNGTITQLILQWISGEPAFGSDVVSFDVDEDTVVLWHCGLAPLSMADPDVKPEATIHSNRKMPLLMQFPLKPGRVTIARLSEATGTFRLIVGTGEMLKAPPAFTGTTGTLRFDSGAQQVLDTIMTEGLEHHVSLTYGDHEKTLLALAKMLKIPVLRL